MLGKLLLPVHTKRAIKNGIQDLSVGYTEAFKIGIIFKYLGEAHYQRVLSFAGDFEKDQKEISILVFCPKPDIKYDFPNYTNKNLSFWGRLSSEEIELFLQTKYDFLINLDLEPHPFVDSVLSRVQAKCKIGRYKVQREVFYQLMIHIDPLNDFEQFLEQVNHYLKKLRAHA